jgi:probable rRNA maturation factor
LKKRMLVKISARIPLQKGDIRRLKRSLVRMLDTMVEEPGLEISLALVGEQEMKELNHRYLKKDESTDVLAFPQMSPGELAERAGRSIDSVELLGDIVICTPVAALQAAQMGESLYDEIELLAAHGLLHLLGYEDETVSGADVMDAAETKLLGRSIVR